MTSSQSKNFTNTQINQLKDMKGYAFTSDGKAMFYAGSGNWRRAESYARANKMKPIQSTRPQKVIASVEGQIRENKNSKMAVHMPSIWNAASRSYAAQVKGDVKTFVAGADTNSIFRKTELSTILNNKKVEKINGLERTKIDSARRRTFARLRQQGVDRRRAAILANGSAHRKVSIQEIRQDLQKGQQQKNEALKADALKRLSALREQNKIEVQRSQKIKIDQERQNKIESHQAVKKYSAERYQSIHQKNYDKAIRQGVKHLQAKQIAQDRVKHVKEKLVLNAERKNLQQKGQALRFKEAMDYQKKLTDFKNRQINDLRIQAQKQGVSYKGPPQKDPSLSHKADKANAQAFEQRTHLRAAFDEGRFKETEFQKRSENIESSRERMIDRSLSEGMRIQQSNKIEHRYSHGLSHGG